MSSQYTHFPDLVAEMVPPNEGMQSQVVLQNDDVKAIVFGFSEGHELAKHTAPKPVILYFIEGEAELTMDGDVVSARKGSVVHIAAGLPHSVLAKTPMTMLLLLLK